MSDYCNSGSELQDLLSPFEQLRDDACSAKSSYAPTIAPRAENLRRSLSESMRKPCHPQDNLQHGKCTARGQELPASSLHFLMMLHEEGSQATRYESLRIYN